MYGNFLLFHFAITILCDRNKYSFYSDLAQKLLERFVEQFAEIYGDHHIVYNMHCLTHLANDTKLFGCLDDYSAFSFESFYVSSKACFTYK